MGYAIQVENIKCGGCANSIRTKLIGRGVALDVAVDIEQGLVDIDGDTASREQAIDILAGMGYPETGSVEGLKAAAAKAKSFVSCAVGRIDNAKSGSD
jgi:copper chaperone